MLVELVENSVDYICILSNFSTSQGRCLPHDPPGKCGGVKVGPATKYMTKITKELGKNDGNRNSKQKQKQEAEQKDGSCVFDADKEREYF